MTIPHEPFNTAVRDGSIAGILERILKDTKPESVYFTERNGHRGAILMFDLADPSKIPAAWPHGAPPTRRQSHFSATRVTFKEKGNPAETGFPLVIQMVPKGGLAR